MAKSKIPHPRGKKVAPKKKTKKRGRAASQFKSFPKKQK